MIEWKPPMQRTDNEIYRELAEAATRRVDLVKEELKELRNQVRELERDKDRREGSMTGLARVQPWIATIFSAFALLKTLGIL